jgi:hypothetical protein
MSATQNAPVVVKKAWEDEATKQELVDYFTVENEEGGETSRKIVNFVSIDDGSRGVEHLLMHTFTEFMIHASEASSMGQPSSPSSRKQIDSPFLEAHHL